MRESNNIYHTEYEPRTERAYIREPTYILYIPSIICDEMPIRSKCCIIGAGHVESSYYDQFILIYYIFTCDICQSF